MDKNDIKNGFTASLHTHVRSIYDAFIEAHALCERIKEMGGKGCAVTDHGVVTSIEDYRRVFAEYGLKMIPGVELYVDGGLLGRLHLILLGRNDNGYKGIRKIVTESNYNLQNGFPVITEERLFQIMEEYKGDIFALSACMQGVLSAVFLLNGKVEKQIMKIRCKKSKLLEQDDVNALIFKDTELADAEKELVEAQDNLTAATQKRDAIKAAAEMKFVQREKAIARMQKNGEDTAAAMVELEADKKKAEAAKAELDTVKANLDAAKKKLSEKRKIHAAKTELYEKLLKLDAEEDELVKEFKTEDKLYLLAVNKAKEYRQVFGKSFFLAEVQYHGIPEEKTCFPKVVEVAKELNIPLVATNDVHILTNSEDDRLRRQVMRSMRYDHDVFEEESVGDSELYLKNNSELYDALTQIISPDDAVRAINNIDVLFDACNVEFKTDKHYPKYRT